MAPQRSAKAAACLKKAPRRKQIKSEMIHSETVVHHIPRPSNKFFSFKSGLNFVRTKSPPQLVKGQVGDVVGFLYEHPVMYNYLQEMIDSMPEGTDGRACDFNKWCGKMWQAQSETFRQIWTAYADANDAEHERRHPNYRYRPQARKSGQRGARTSKKVTANAPPSPQSTTSSPANSSSLSPFDPPMPFTPGTSMQSLHGTPESIPAAGFDYAVDSNAYVSYFKSPYDFTGGYRQPVPSVPESPWVQGSPYAYGMGMYQNDVPMLADYDGYKTQLMPTFNTNTGEGWGAQYCPPLPPHSDGENGKAVLGSGSNHPPQGNNALLGFDAPQYGSQNGSPLDFGFASLSFGGSPASGSPLDDTFGDLNGIINFGSWQASGSPVSHTSALNPGY